MLNKIPHFHSSLGYLMICNYNCGALISASVPATKGSSQQLAPETIVLVRRCYIFNTWLFLDASSICMTTSWKNYESFHLFVNIHLLAVLSIKCQAPLPRTFETKLRYKSNFIFMSLIRERHLNKIMYTVFIIKAFIAIWKWVYSIFKLASCYSGIHNLVREIVIGVA